MDEPTKIAIIRRFEQFHPLYDSLIVDDRIHHEGIQFTTPGWKYTVIPTEDGFAIVPPNSSPRYVQLVEMLMEAILEANYFRKINAANPMD